MLVFLFLLHRAFIRMGNDRRRPLNVCSNRFFLEIECLVCNGLGRVWLFLGIEKWKLKNLSIFGGLIELFSFVFGEFEIAHTHL